MKLFVASVKTHDGDIVLVGVYSSREAAETAGAETQRQAVTPYGAVIERAFVDEFELDAPPSV